MGIRERVPAVAQPPLRKALLGFGAVTGRWRMAPSFMVIGGQRCGTTTIFKSLSQHPQVLRPPIDKGTDYYTLYFDRGQSWYRRRMPLAPTSRVRTRKAGAPQAFEACTYYMFHPFAIERIANDFPDLKLVAMLRNPVERAFSAYKHEFARGFESEPDFLQALELEDTRLKGELERMKNDVAYESLPHRHHAYRRRGQFAEQLERVYSYFPRDQVHVMESESFFDNPATEFAKLIDFLGLRSWRPATFEQHNARPSNAMPEDARRHLTDHYAAYDAQLADVLGRQPSWRSVS